MIDIHSHQRRTDIFCVENIIYPSEINNYNPNTPFSVGLHPYGLDKVCKNNLDNILSELEKKLAFNNVYLFGEAGLDKQININFDWQITVFEQQLLLNKKINKPFIVHCVAAYNEIIAIYKKNKCGFPLIFHSFNKKYTVAQQLQKQGFYLSFGAALLHNLSTQNSFIQADKNFIFLETDNNSSCQIEDIYQQAELLIKKIEKTALKTQIYNNLINILPKKANFAPVLG